MPFDLTDRIALDCAARDILNTAPATVETRRRRALELAARIVATSNPANLVKAIERHLDLDLFDVDAAFIRSLDL